MKPSSFALRLVSFIFACMAVLFLYGHLVHHRQAWTVDHPDGWWSFTDIKGATYFFKRRDDLDATGKHSCYDSYSSFNSSMRSFCYPNLILTGYAKSGTSNLHHVVKAYKNSYSLPKELCPAVPVSRTLLETFFYPQEMAYALNEEFFQRLPNEASMLSVGSFDLDNSPQLIIFSSCIDVNLNLFANRVLRNPYSVFIFLIRDYADWLWSAYK
jgi:hypothetical protein